MNRAPVLQRLRFLWLRIRRLPARFWLVLATVFGIADFLTWSLLADVLPEHRPYWTLAFVSLAALITLFAALRAPTETEAMSNARHLWRIARGLYEQNDYSQALGLLKTATTLDPDNVQARGLLGRTLLRLGLYPDSIGPLSFAIERSTVPANKHLLRGNRALALLLLNQLGRALDDLDRNLEEDSHLKVSRRLRALTWYHLGQFENALQDVDLAIADHPNYICARPTRAIVLLALGRRSEAEEELTACEALLPQDADDFYCLAQAYSQLRSAEATISALAVAVERDPQYSPRALHDPLFASLRETPQFSYVIKEAPTAA